jgi:hypothetical protein
VSKGRPPLAVAALLTLAAVTFAVVRPTNFGGSDEWLHFSLVSRWIVDVPWANRPLNLIWHVPAWAFFPDRLLGFLVFHALWIGLGGVLVYLTVLRLLGAATPLAFLAGVFTIVWAPSDATRLCSVQMIIYSGCTVGTVLAVWLAVEGWLRRRLALAVSAVVAGGVAILSHEAALAPLALVPLLFLLAGGGRERRRLMGWTLAAVVVLGAASLRAALPLWTDPGRVSYQSALVGQLGPDRLASGALRQLRLHVAPLVHPTWERPGPVVPIAVAVFLAGILVTSGAWHPREREAGVKGLALVSAAGVGCLWALLAYVPFVPTTHGAFRTEFLAAPGIGLLLAAGVVGVASLVPGRARMAVVLLLGTWIVFQGTQRTASFEERWESWSAFPGQSRNLRELAAIAPDLAPGTLVVLVPRGGTWRFDLTFRHAIRYLYEGRALGHVMRADPLLYETYFEAAGIRSIPDPVVRGPWQEGPATFPYDAVVAVSEDAGGHLKLQETWPGDLPPLPAGARYEPRTRLRPGRLPRLSILG